MTTVALLSNYRTRNLGNVALTRVVQRLMADVYGSDHLLALHKLPHPVGALSAVGDPEGWVRRLEHQVGPLRDLPAPPASAYGERPLGLAPLILVQASTSRVQRAVLDLGHTWVGTRLRARKDRPAARTHVAGIVAADDVVWNVAGELNLVSDPTSRLVDMAVALDQGKRTAMVNFSFEPTDAALAHLRVLAPRLDCVIGRDQRTVDALVDLGVAAGRAHLAPDAAFLVGSDTLPELAVPPTSTRRGVVGIALHGVIPIDAPRWARVYTELERQGHQVEIISSHRAIDGPVIDQLQAATGGRDLTVQPEFTEIEPYMAHLSGLDAVVTGRFHTAVLGLLAGTTVVGVDTYGTKIIGGMGAAGLDDVVASGPDWPDQALARVAAAPIVGPDELARIRGQILDVWTRAFPL